MKERNVELHILLIPRVIPLKQEIIKVREWISHIGVLPKVIPLKLFLDIIPSFSMDITRALRECFRGGSVYVSFRFVQSKGKPPTVWGCLWYFNYKQKSFASRCFNTFRGFNRSLNKRQIFPAQTKTTEWTAEKWVGKRQSKQKPRHNAAEQTDGRKCKEKFAAQAANGIFSREFRFIQFVYHCQKYPKQNM